MFLQIRHKKVHKKKQKSPSNGFCQSMKKSSEERRQ